MLIVMRFSRMILSIWLSTELAWRLSSWSKIASVVYVLFSRLLCSYCMHNSRGDRPFCSRTLAELAASRRISPSAYWSAGFFGGTTMPETCCGFWRLASSVEEIEEP